MTKKYLKERVKSLLPKEMTDAIIEIRDLQEDFVAMDIASNRWPKELDSFSERLHFMFELFRKEDWYKNKAAAICPVTRDEYLEMKTQEMRKRYGF